MTAGQLMRRNGFSLVEVLLAIFLLGIGTIGIVALFPVGIHQQQESIDDVVGPTVAENALSLLRARLAPGDFGTFEEFSFAVPPLYTVPGDWPWLRPGFILQDDTGTDTFDGSDYDERGSIDIFSYRLTRRRRGLPEASVAMATEFPSGTFSAGGLTLYGIPYNTDRYSFDSADREPRVIVTQQERYYPMVCNEAAAATRAPPQYVWDCMFRRFQGRVYVAIFVYRVTVPGGGRVNYVTPPNPLSSAASSPPAVDLPPLPYRRDMTGAPGEEWPAWDTFGLTPGQAADDSFVAGTPPGERYDPRDPEVSWQQPGQWLLDQNNTVHRVLSRTRETINDQAAVELLRPVLPVSSFDANVSYFNNSLPPSDWGVKDVVTHLWYIPAEVEVDVNGDGALDGTFVNLTPVYAVVRQL